MATEIFLGRDLQLAQFKGVLEEFFTPPREGALPPVVLISGQGGIGKTTLLAEFRTMAQDLYRNRFDLLELDWHTQRRINAALQADPTEIDARVIYQSLHSQALQCVAGWRKTNDYTKAIIEIEKAVSKATAQINALRDASRPTEEHRDARKTIDAVSAATGKAVEMGLGSAGAGPVSGPLGKLAETLTKYGASFLPESLDLLAGKLPQPTFDLLSEADAQLARAMGNALKQAALNRPIVVMFDTYEIVDERDPLIRLTIKTAGSRVLWVIAGRRELYATRTNTPRGRIDGYREEDRFSYRVLPVDLNALAREEIREYFQRAAPERPALTDDELQRVDSATGAIPLAIRLAAEIWRKQGDIDSIASQEGVIAESIVDEMVGRYLQHCVDREEDRRTLAAIALARGNAQVLEAMLLPEHDEDVARYREQLKRVRHRYDAVHHEDSTREPRLHDEPARFFRERLQDDRRQDWVREFNQRALDWLLHGIATVIDYHSSLDDLCADEDFEKAALEILERQFWLDEDSAWKWLMPRYLEGLAFSSALQDGLLQTAASWRRHLSQRGQRRLQILEQADRYSYRANERLARRNLIDEDEQRGWLEDGLFGARHCEERLAIRAWTAADDFLMSELHEDALASLKQSIANLIKLEDGVRKKIADLARQIDFAFFMKKNYSQAAAAARLRVEVTPDDPRAWRELGADYSWLNDHKQALEHHKKALELDPTDAKSWRELGIDYVFGRHYQDALHRLNRAIEIDETDKLAWSHLGYLAMIERQTECAASAFERAAALDTTYANSLNLWGTMLYRANDWQSALEKFREANSRDLQLFQASVNLLAMMHLLHLPDQGFTLLDRTRQLREREHFELMHSAQLHALEGDADRALEQFESAIRATPNDAVYARFLPAFHHLRENDRFRTLTADAPGSSWDDY